MLSTPSRLSWIVSLFALALSSGCVISSYGEDEWCPDDSASCHDSFDCRAGQYCRHGTCREAARDAQRCTSNAQCPGAQLCIDGVCCQSCGRDRDCSSGRSCSNDSFCDPTPPPQQGTAGWHDSNGGGSTPPPPSPAPDAGSGCRQNTDCGSGSYCINAVCYHGCSASAQCSTGDDVSGGPVPAGSRQPVRHQHRVPGPAMIA